MQPTVKHFPSRPRAFNMLGAVRGPLLVMAWLLAGGIGHAAPAVGVATSTIKHPVLERWRNAAVASQGNLTESSYVKELMALTDAQVLAIIPVQSPTISDSCPSCALKDPTMTAHEAKSDWMEFDPQHPDQIKCRKCAAILPGPVFPINKTETFVNRLGESVEIGSYVSEKNPRTPKEKAMNVSHALYLRGYVDTARNSWLLPRMNGLAQLYQGTRDERYAKRLIFILHEYAKRYPHYVFTGGYGLHYWHAKQMERSGYAGGTRWGRRDGSDLPMELLELFDLAASSPSLDAATKKRIIDDLFLEPLRQLERRDLANENPYYGNVCPLKQIAERALVLEDPERIHLAYSIIRNVPQFSTSFDAVFNQSLGYGSLFRMTFFSGAHLLDGYSDPAGYVGKDGRRLDNVYPLKEMEEYYAQLDTNFERLRLPSGGLVTYDDSGSGFGSFWWSGDGKTCRSLAQSSNVLLPGLRRAVLGAGSGDKQVQVHLDFAEHGVNHGHASGQALQIYAFGHYLLDDFPYHKGKLRPYGSNTISHQTVLIDHKTQLSRGNYTAGDVELYAPQMDGVSFIRVDDSRAYGGLASKYTRSLLLNATDPDLPYVVDVFEVTGGSTHDYLLRSSSQHPSLATASLVTQPLAGLRPLLPATEKWVEPNALSALIGSGYGLFFDAGKAPINGPFYFTSACAEPWAESKAIDNKTSLTGAYRAGPESWPDRPPVGIRHHVAVKDGYEFLSFSSPNLGATQFLEGQKLSENYLRIPHRIVRHVVPAGGRSVFVVVHEPYHHAPKITSVTRLDQGDDNLLALRIEAPGRVDTLVYALDRSRAVTVGGVNMNGRLAMISRQAKQPPRAYLVAGTTLQAEGVDLKTKLAGMTGTITAAQRRWDGKGINRLKVTATTELPTGDALRGSWLMVQLGPWAEKGGPWDKSDAEDRNDPKSTTAKLSRDFPGATQALEIDHVATEADGTWIYTKGDHGLLIDDKTTKEFYWPCRTFSGPCGFVIPTATTTHPLAMPPRAQALAIATLPTPPAGLKPGAKITVFSGTGNDLKNQKQIAESTLTPANEADLEARIRTLKIPGAIRVAGFLQVPADGIYTIHFGVADEYRMTLGGVPIIEAFRGQNLMPDNREVKLVKGCYPVTLECFRAANERAQVWATTDWEGPGLPRCDFLQVISTSL